MAKKTSDRAYYMFAMRIIGDFGVSIAAPVVVFVLVGQYMDGEYGKGPLFTILGFTLAAAVSARMIYRKAKRYGDEYQRLGQKNNGDDKIIG